ncbi:ABC transporter substrate-binding protein [Rubrimonas cliftonensis]|uniref:Thiamine pyrimidine synthase n=1 Tax=Rubrimonas cliftonensis TaxID=89524 RepID=A0A1H4DKN3_9RHOB|nr:ABC transporter substrate-binding protein [Rubrimonas cliftonensis]SEA73098.1 ABC-type nitrate/sulfonate/bicarbonate transport system, substrate-binding protein [Rubrimonas cliftonensis]
MTLRLTRRGFAAAGASLLALGAAPRLARAATPFAMQAAWINDAEFMGYMIAADEGYYAEEGLDLEYLSGGPDVIPEGSLVSGRADVALTTPDTTISAIVAQGAPFRIIGAQYQKNPIGVVSLKASGIAAPKDLIGRTLAVPPVNTISVEAMLKMNDIDPGDVRIVPYAYDPTPLLKGEIDASIDFTTNVPYSIAQAGGDPASFLLFDFGFTIYNDTVVVTEQTLAEKRDLLVKWLRASRRGWETNYADPEGWPRRIAGNWFAGTGRTVENEVFFNLAQKPLMEHPAGFLAMDEAGIEANLAALRAIGIEGDRSMFDTTLLAEI